MKYRDITEVTIKLAGFGPKKGTESDGSQERFMEAIRTVTEPNPINPRERMFPGAAVKMKIFGKSVDIDDIRSTTRGGGRAALRQICDLADEHRVTLCLYAKGYAHTPTEKLIELYQSFGFVIDPDWHDEDGQQMERRPS